MTKPLPLPMKELLQRIEAKTEKTASCWFWKGIIGRRGRPQLAIRVDGKHYTIYPRRVLYESAFGGLEDRDYLIPVTAACRQWVCVNPYHMKNMKRRSPWNKNSIGSFRTKYDENTVLLAMALYAPGITQKAIATELGIPETTVSAYVLGRSRRSVSKRERLPQGYWRTIRKRQRNLVSTRYLPGGRLGQNAKLTWQEVLVIVGLRRAGYRLQAIGENFGQIRQGVWGICYGKAWLWLTREIKLTPSRSKKKQPDEKFIHPDDALVYENWKGGKTS